MQRSVCIILLPLLLCTLFGIILVSYSYLDTQDSVLSTSLAVSGSNINLSAIIGEKNKKGAFLLTFATVHPTQLTIMPPKSRTTRKRMLLEDDHNSVNLYHAESQGESSSTQGDMREMMDNQPSIAAISENSFADEVTQSTRRRKKRCLHHNGASENLCYVEHEDTDAVGQRDKQFQRNQQNPNTMVNQSLFAAVSSSNDAGNTIVGGSSFCGQASYQKIKQGVITGYEDFGNNTFTCIHCNASFWLKEANKQKSKNAPIIYTNCCQKGEIKIEQSNPTPSFLEQLLDSKNGKSTFFRENIRIYNSMFSFTSMGATIDHSINTGSGPYVFKINGQVHHLMGSMLPPDGECPKYAQLYIYDTKNEVSNRMNAIDPSHINQKIRPDIVQGLINMFDEINELVKTYRTIRDKFEDNSLPSFNMTMFSRQPTDSKQYEEPTSDEIGGLIVGDIGEFDSNKDIIIQSNDGHLKRIFKIHPKYMSLQYPILFPYGEDGYKPNLLMYTTATNRKKKKEKISMRSFIAYQIQDRNNEMSTLLKGGRLFQQFLVDSYATIEEYRLDYIRKNQRNLRSEIYKDICTASSIGINEGRNIGQKIILPSSHTASPRYMINNYQDAMTICRQYGNPDLFITFTCNVKWPEILRFLENKPGYKPEDRPDIISRIFKLKLDDMIRYVKSGEPFGEIEADVCTVEFQKRGLPHAHMLFWLKRNYKCYTATDVVTPLIFTTIKIDIYNPIIIHA